MAVDALCFKTPPIDFLVCQLSEGDDSKTPTVQFSFLIPSLHALIHLWISIRAGIINCISLEEDETCVQ